MDLESLKYSELQKLAKSVGIKANQKTEKLLKALKDYYSDREANENGTSEILIKAPRVQRRAGRTRSSTDKGTPSGLKERKRHSTFKLDKRVLVPQYSRNQQTCNKDWEKVHKKAFAKFDSLDVYLEKKRKRTEDLTASVKKARTVLHEVQEAVTKLKNKRTPSLGKKQADAPFKPTVTSTKNISFNFGASSGASQKPKTPLGRRSTHSAAKPFKPTVVSTKDMNLNFTASKTPSNGVSVKAVTKQRGSGCGVRASNNQHPHDTTAAGNVSTRKSFATPFKFTGNLNTSQAKSTTKPAFDLKASLARPITWKPHTGKLKPMDYSLYGGADAANRSVSKASSNRHLDMYKSHKTNPRAGRRAAAAAHRTEQKGRLQMKRRGISAAP
ncbi:hypothetical protein BaRGS_00039826 [Batillaria attramentaria]|uniref:Nucleolar and spindle-associated protein 1 n=1 Tax=Batillaria attramentaria TaxID=370345 RepID=A0ABD0J2X0_9CAEN